MNQKGEATLFCVFGIVALLGLFLLAHLSLQRSFSLMRTRTDLFLCAKEAKGELKLYLTFMGRTNWGIKNLNRASWIALFIPGLQGVAGDAQKVKRLLIESQNLRLSSYVKKLISLRQRGCPLDPGMVTTPFTLSGRGYARNKEGAALLKETEWTYHMVKRPYRLALRTDASGLEMLKPRIEFTAEEKGVRSLSPWSSRSRWPGW